MKFSENMQITNCLKDLETVFKDHLGVLCQILGAKLLLQSTSIVHPHCFQANIFVLANMGVICVCH